MPAMSKNLKLRLICSFFNRIASFAITPFMTLYFAVNINVKAASLIAITQIIIAYSSNFIGGYIGDHFDEKKVLFRGQTVHALLQFMLAGLMYIHAIPTTIVMMYFISIFVSNLYKSTFSSLLVASVNEENRKLSFTIDYLGLNVALAIGMILGALTFNNTQYIVFLVSGFIILSIGFVLNHWYESDTQNTAQTIPRLALKEQFKELLRGYKQPLQDAPFRNMAIGVSLIYSVQLALPNGISVNLKEQFQTVTLFNSIQLTGIKMFTWLQIENVAAILLLTMVIFAYFSVNISYKRLMAVIIIFIITYAYMFLSLNWGILLTLGLIGSICEALIMPEFQAIQSKLIPLDKKATYVSFNQLGSYLSQLITAIGLYVLAAFGPSIAAIFSLLFGIIGILLVKPILKNKIV